MLNPNNVDPSPFRMDPDERMRIYHQLADSIDMDSLSFAIRSWAIEKGFESALAENSGDQQQTLFSLAQCGLVTSEIGELVEAIRKPSNDDHLKSFSAVDCEIADTIIRLLHLHARIGTHRIGYVIAKKMEFNETRPYMHGKKA